MSVCLKAYKHVMSNLAFTQKATAICLILIFVGAVGYFECHSSYGAFSWACLSFIYCCLCRSVRCSSHFTRIYL